MKIQIKNLFAEIYVTINRATAEEPLSLLIMPQRCLVEISLAQAEIHLFLFCFVGTIWCGAILSFAHQMSTLASIKRILILVLTQHAI